MNFHIITIFPNLFNSFLNESLIKKSIQKGLNKICVHNLRDWSKDKHRTVDDRPYGGGPGMVLMAEPIVKAVDLLKHRNIENTKKFKVILLSPTGKQFSQKMAKKFSKLDELILICGRYEAVDARVEKIVDEKISIGPYVLSGGEIAAMVIIESVARLIPGYLSNPESLLKETHSQFQGKKQYPQYTRPEVIEINNKKYRVPKILLSGDHQKIKKWREEHTS